MKRAIIILLAMATPAAADSLMPPSYYADTQLPDPMEEARAQALMEEIRCLVCQGQSIADSDAEMAGDMRAMVRTRIAAGEPPAAIRTWLISRYGRWIAFRPPLDVATSFLWIAPILLLVGGGLLAARRFRRHAH